MDPDWRCISYWDGEIPASYVSWPEDNIFQLGLKRSTPLRSQITNGKRGTLKEGRLTGGSLNRFGWSSGGKSFPKAALLFPANQEMSEIYKKTHQFLGGKNGMVNGDMLMAQLRKGWWNDSVTKNHLDFAQQHKQVLNHSREQTSFFLAQCWVCSFFRGKEEPIEIKRQTIKFALKQTRSACCCLLDLKKNARKSSSIVIVTYDRTLMVSAFHGFSMFRTL